MAKKDDVKDLEYLQKFEMSRRAISVIRLASL